MKALVKKNPTEGIWLEEVPIPQINSNEVLIKIRKTSICGTDVHIYKWDAWAQKNVPLPLVIGHEFVGEIVEIGSNVQNLKVGQRVSAEGHITCGHCKACKMGKKHLCFNVRGFGYHLPGCFAEYAKLPAENIFILPESVSDDLAAIFDPFGNAVHTALTYNLTGEDVLITGAGPIGIMAAAIAQKAGARHIFITDINPFRLELAKKMGATCAVNMTEESLTAKMQEKGILDGFTVGMEMSGNPAGLNTLLQSMQYGGNVALLGILPPHTQIDWDLVIFRMLTLKGIYGREIFSTWFKMTSLLDVGLNLEPLITHHFPMQEYQEAFATMISTHSGKIILNWE
ncbi:MAG: L-threonine 3-dehydrogenase [Parachlamydia sp.]|nr:MAG: L-threonine 3-dehydrogenase [Parachlamydia sp.]